MAEFGLIKSFQIDNGELDGLSPQECFVLGYELAQVDQSLKTTSEIHQPVHAENQVRIESAYKDADRQYRLTWLPGDVSESWLLLEVAAVKSA
jgi:hypothetical protein